MKLPGIPAYKGLKTPIMLSEITENFIPASQKEKAESAAAMSYPAYIIEHHDYVVLAHSLEAVTGLLKTQEGDASAFVYVTPDISTGELICMGKGSADMLEDILPLIINSMYSGKMNVYYARDPGMKFSRLTNDPARIKLVL